VTIYDMADAVGEKRDAQVELVLGRLLPKGYSRESFAGKAAHKLDAARIDALTQFVEDARQQFGVPAWPSASCRTAKWPMRGLRCTSAGRAGKSGCGHAVHDRFQHQGAHHLDVGQAGGRGKIQLGHAGHASAADVQAGQRRHDRAGED
jgi:hypothetical protein